MEESIVVACPFCSLPSSRIVASDEFSLIIRDGFPISPGHTLLIPKRHIGSFFDITENERGSLMRFLKVAKEELQNEFSPDGYNIGINDGSAAGQTVAHLHIHLIPRYIGDCHDPRGGIRWIIPSKADYWTKA